MTAFFAPPAKGYRRRWFWVVDFMRWLPCRYRPWQSRVVTFAMRRAQRI